MGWKESIGRRIVRTCDPLGAEQIRAVMLRMDRGPSWWSKAWTVAWEVAVLTGMMAVFLLFVDFALDKACR